MRRQQRLTSSCPLSPLFSLCGADGDWRRHVLSPPFSLCAAAEINAAASFPRSVESRGKISSQFPSNSHQNLGFLDADSCGYTRLVRFLCLVLAMIDVMWVDFIYNVIDASFSGSSTDSVGFVGIWSHFWVNLVEDEASCPKVFFLVRLSIVWLIMSKSWNFFVVVDAFFVC